MAIAAPFLSMFDTGATAEGSIDPLSLAQTYDRLANRLLPHVTVRMHRPRFVTAIAVAALVCEELLDEIAADQRTPAWLVFEWHVIEGFMRAQHAEGASPIRDIPGRDKVSTAIRFGKRLGADSYLKTPTVFGFTGIYRRLARGLEIVNDDMLLDEGGYELLRVWESEQHLEGFQTGTQGPGADLRDSLRRAVIDAMRKGYVARQPSWHRWPMLFAHLRPDRPGPRERDLLASRLLRPSTDPETAAVSGELLRALQKRGRAVTREQEPDLFRKLIPKASAELRARLTIVDAYEGLARLLTDGFMLVRHLSTKQGGAPIYAGDFGQTPLARRILQQLPHALERIEELFAGDPEGGTVLLLLARYRNVATTSQLFEELVRHHEDAQRAKPPNGKRPWIERVNGVAVRPQYSESAKPEGRDLYVHEYRTPSACQFLQDLGKLPR
jgi:hypothetical protein